MYRNILKVIVTVSLMSLLIVFSSAVNTYEVKADTEQVQTVQESNNLPSTEEEIENMSLTDKLLFLILIVMCVFLGAFVGYVVMDRLRYIMSFFEFLEMIISELVPVGLIITVIPSFIVFCLMKMWKIVIDIFK